ncbi:MAG TPA: iron-sulfur cluster assembly scaffold protein [Dongiaceae bacterium]|jgi:nitrogen fixation NifU-like protein|nr:iron-sulfur cluster assembly scaffold protein [Dongiaceae bacterium]HSE74019.1 iron-sulfur cluster assembly scaffold protein [Dongiaceae bacterium]
MSEALYHDALVARARGAFGKGRLADATGTATVDNPLCGDRVTLDLAVRDGRIAAIGHQVRGCLLCEAAAAIIAEHCRGSGKADLDAIGAAARRLMAEGGALEPQWQCLEIFRPVHQAKSRRDCVLLPFEALARAASGIT